MVYKEFQGKKLSALGFGAMRLPVMSGDNSRIDIEKTKEMVAYAMENGVNYYDTAWGYHGGQSELVMGDMEDMARDKTLKAPNPESIVAMLKK